jgi:hypothetical protein
MRHARTTPEHGREAMRERQRRGRTETPARRVHYPALSSLQIDFDFSDQGDFIPSPQVVVFHPPAPAYFCFACPYSDCDGEFDLTRTVDLAVSSGEPQSSGQVRCAGTRHRGALCTLCLEFSITPNSR